MSTMYDTALRLHAAQISVIPCWCDSKQPAVREWSTWQQERPPVALMQQWFQRQERALAVVCGTVSGNLEGIDIDHKPHEGYPDAATLLDRLQTVVEANAPGLWRRLVIDRSPNGGYHLAYRCPTIARNGKLAQRPATDAERAAANNPKLDRVTLIETRGEGGYLISAPSPGYARLQGDLAEPPTITPTERTILIDAARSLNMFVPPSRIIGQVASANGTKPGADYNARASIDDVQKVLEAAQWTVARSSGNDCVYLRRPGKRDGWSATLGYAGTNLLYVFSSNAPPFEPDTAHMPFSVYAHLEHNGDFARAARALAEQGYGERSLLAVDARGVPYCSNGHGLLHLSRNGKTWYCREQDCRVFAQVDDYPLPVASDSVPVAMLDRIIAQACTEPVINHTDLGNARRLVARHGQNIHYVPAWGVWLVWNGSFWERDETGVVARLARDTIAAMYAEAATLTDVDARRALAKWALASESRSRIENMIALAKDELGISIRHIELDAQAWRLNCWNGTIDLRTGTLHPHQRADLITKRIDIDYDPSATCPTLHRFLHRVMDGDAQRITFLQRAAGYTLTGDTSEQCLFYLYGTGKNGKSTWSELLMHLLGAYALKTPTETLMVKQYGGSVPNDIARLPGARMVLSAEIEEGKRLAESLVKDLTGGDTIVARFLRQEFFEFRPTHKLWMYGNHKPIIRGTDEGIWRRIHLIPFDVWIAPEERDPQLMEKLIAELPGILRWAVQGCLDWQRDGLVVPEAVRVATAGYRSEMDVVGAFIDECCVVGPNYKVSAAALYDAYKDWCDENGEHPLKKKRLGMQLTERGFEGKKGAGNQSIRCGLALGETTHLKDSPDHSEEEDSYIFAESYLFNTKTSKIEASKQTHREYLKTGKTGNFEPTISNFPDVQAKKALQQPSDTSPPPAPTGDQNDQRIGNGRMQFSHANDVYITPEKITYVLDKLSALGPGWARSYMSRVEGFENWPQRVQTAVLAAEVEANHG